MRTVNFDLMSKDDIEKIVKEKVENENKLLYDYVNKLREQVSDLQMLVKHFVNVGGKNEKKSN